MANDEGSSGKKPQLKRLRTASFWRHGPFNPRSKNGEGSKKERDGSRTGINGGSRSSVIEPPDVARKPSVQIKNRFSKSGAIISAPIHLSQGHDSIASVDSHPLGSNPVPLQDTAQDPELPAPKDVKLSSRVLKAYWLCIEDKARYITRVQLFHKYRNTRAKVSIFSLSIQKRDTDVFDFLDMYVVWSKRHWEGSKARAGRGAKPDPDCPTYVAYFSHWQEGVLLALVRRGAGNTRTEEDVLPIVPSRGSHVLIYYDPDEWIVYRQYVNFGAMSTPFVLSRSVFRGFMDLFESVRVMDRDKESIVWYNPDSHSKNIKPDTLFDKCKFVTDEMQCYSHLEAGDQRYSVYRLLDLNSDLEVTSVLYETEERQQTMCFRADPGAILVLLNKRHKSIAHVMKPSSEKQRIVCRFDPKIWRLAHVLRSSRAIWKKASTYSEGPDKEGKLQDKLRFDRFVIVQSECITKRPGSNISVVRETSSSDVSVAPISKRLKTDDPPLPSDPLVAEERSQHSMRSLSDLLTREIEQMEMTGGHWDRTSGQIEEDGGFF